MTTGLGNVYIQFYLDFIGELCMLARAVVNERKKFVERKVRNADSRYTELAYGANLVFY